MIKKIFVSAFSLIGGIAFVDTVYLASEHYFGRTVICSFFNGCDKVLNSSWSVIAGIPISYIGVIYYAIILGLIVLYAFSENVNVLKLIIGLTGAGFFVSFFLIYAQVFIIKAFCFYCLVSAASSTALFFISLLAFIKVKVNEELGKVG